jgi:hypothetical protein
MSTNSHFSLDDVPNAASMQVMACDHCGSVHFVLFDRDDEPFAYASVSADQSEDVRAQMTKAIVRVRGMKRQ